MLKRASRYLRHIAQRGVGEAGQAMLIVLGALALFATIPVVVITTTVNQLPLTTNDLNWNAAYEAAQAGLSDYLQHLDADPTYTRYTRSSPDSTNAALTGWLQLSTNPGESYAYAPSVKNGQVLLKVTGKAGLASRVAIRTFLYSLHPASTLDDLYWSNYESVDPALAGSNGDGSGCNNGYTAEHYNQNGGPPSACQIQFYGDSARHDELFGPVFSDDSFYVTCSNNSGPVFDSTVQSGNIYATSTPWVGSGCPNTAPPPTFNAGVPVNVAAQSPQTSTADVTPAKNVGCYISGSSTSVSITINGNGTITWANQTGSNATVQNNSANPNTSGGNQFCGPSNGPGTITLSNLRSSLIYVNGPIALSEATNSSFSGFLTLVSGPPSCSSPCSVTGYNISITGNITYPSTDISTGTVDGYNNVQTSDPSDALGLIAQNSVILAQPAKNQNTTIDAAVLALSDSFYVQNWADAQVGGTLTVFGSIAQNFRGAVGTFNGDSIASGYTKLYYYDSTLQILWPPYFIPPAGATWNATNYQEMKPGCAGSVPGTGNC